MKITRETDHAMKCILYLSRRPGLCVPIAEIAKNNAIPKSFLAKILQKLTKVGLVRSQQGSSGGFRLLKNPKEVTLREVFVAIQGPMVINDCVIDNKVCERSQYCSVHPVWNELKDLVEEKMRSITFLTLSKNELKRYLDSKK